ncbi:Methyltransf_11 domain-containing protein [Psidium guajava]|nr:Methyltransf_11 domain-containing protein [Psidium guajava]
MWRKPKELIKTHVHQEDVVEAAPKEDPKKEEVQEEPAETKTETETVIESPETKQEDGALETTKGEQTESKEEKEVEGVSKFLSV